MPPTRAGRGSRKNGTSAPSLSASARSRSAGTAPGRSAASPRRTAPASLEPPPSPPGVGTRFTRRIATPTRRAPAARNPAAARTARFVASAGTPACSPERVRATPGSSRSDSPTSSPRSIGRNRLSISWYPSGRRRRMRRPKFTLAGAKTSSASNALGPARLHVAHAELGQQVREQLGLLAAQIPARLLLEQLEGVDRVARQPEVPLAGLARVRIGDEPEMEERGAREREDEPREVRLREGGGRPLGLRLRTRAGAAVDDREAAPCLALIRHASPPAPRPSRAPPSADGRARCADP